MKHSEFKIGEKFRRGGSVWKTTDIGTRVIVAIRIDRIFLTGANGNPGRLLKGIEAEAEGWFDGPPYGVEEQVFDEDDMKGCSTEQTGKE